MNKKRLAKGLTAAALVGVLAIGSTLAYLSANTGQKTNAFTGDKIGGRTEENYNWETAQNYKPGDVINKAPKIIINQDNADAMVALSVDYYGDDVVVDTIDTTTEGEKTYKIANADTATKLSQQEFQRYATVNGWNIDSTNPEKTGEWELIAKTANGSELYMHKAVVKRDKDKDAETNALFGSVTVNAGLRTVTENDQTTTTVYDSTGKVVDFKTVTSSIANSYYVDGNGNILVLDKLPTFVIDVNGFAVQADNLTEGGTDPVTELIKLANDNKKESDLNYYKAV